MGGTPSIFTEQELDDYQELTYFTKKEILHVHKRFVELEQGKAKDKNAKIPIERIKDDLPELKVNPFKDRICKVFSSSDDGTMSFEDFLDMMSVFSENAPKSVKVEYAFRIYDFDEDDVISSRDLQEVVNRLTGDQKLSDEDMQQLIDNHMIGYTWQPVLMVEEEPRKTPGKNHLPMRSYWQAFSHTHIAQFVEENIFEEADLDDDDSLSFAEFEHVISKAPDFMNSFRIRL